MNNTIGSLIVWKEGKIKHYSIVVGIGHRKLLVTYPKNGWEYSKEDYPQDYIQIAPWLKDGTEVWNIDPKSVVNCKNLKKD